MQWLWQTHAEAPEAQSTAAASPLDQAGGVVRSPGKPLDPDVQAGAEQRLGIDLSRVRIHDDEAAAASADAARARAYTVGSHIAFGRGEYRPHDADGRRVMLHELAHVAQQGAKDNALPAPRWIVRSEDAAEREAHEFANHAGPISSWQPNHRTSGGGLARYPKEGQELQERESEALQHGLDPSNLSPEPPDWIRQQMRDPNNAFVPPLVQTVPGSWIQQGDALPEVNPIELFNQPAIHDAIQAIAEGAEATEAAKPGGKVEHSVDKLMPYWQQHFVDSVDYILFRRSDHREARLKALHEAEKKLIQANPSDLISQVEALRAKAAAAWQAEVQTAAQRFLEIAANEAKWATVHQNAAGVKVFGLPESIEGSVTAENNKDTIEFDPKKPITVSPSVVRFMKELQKETKSRVLAENYPRHEQSNLFVGDITGIGKYSFDIQPGITVDDNTGFYEHKKMVEFFIAVDRAAVATNVAWVAFYNDFEVAKEVNETLGKMHVGFSGGGGPKTGNPGPGSFHHGPAPYILHVHFNIMPIDLKEQFDRAQLINPDYSPTRKIDQSEHV
jgi:hypothetical protein